MTSVISKEVVSKVPPLSPTPMMGTGRDGFSEAYMARRAARAIVPKETVYEFTKDPALLHQYYRLREEMFISVWGLDHYSGAEEALDRESHILVARQGLHVIGGARLTISTPAAPLLLPMEKNDFMLRDALPELQLDRCTYCEFSRLAILPDFRAGKVFPEMASRFIKRAIAEGVEHAFNMAPLPLARNYRQAIQSFDLNWDIRSDIKIPDRESFEGIRMVLSMMSRSSIKNRQYLEDVKQAELAD